MESGKTLHQFTAKDRRKILLRSPKWEDLDDFVELFNSVVEEDSDIRPSKKVTREQKADWLKGRLADLEKDDLFCLVAEINGKVIAHSELRRKKVHRGTRQK